MTDKLTPEQIQKYVQARENIASGPIERAAPIARTGFRQYICKDNFENVRNCKELGYTHRVDEKGKPYLIHCKNGEKLYVMEMPIELWEAHQAAMHKDANRGLNDLRAGQVSFNNTVFSQGIFERKTLKHTFEY